MKSTLPLFLIAFASLASTGAWAHGDDETAAIGEEGQASQVKRTVRVDMSDSMRFTPSSFTAKRGETVRFVVHNSGKLRHEFVLGTTQALAEHYEVMKKNPEMEHADPNAVTVEPGKSGEVIWKFTKDGTVAIGCLQPGHYDAGMKGQVLVRSTANAAKQETAIPHSHTH